jgi:Peptidase A4 family
MSSDPRPAPFTQVPTALAGVFAIPAPPASFDPDTASPAELIRHGILWPRPGADSDPRLRAAWTRMFSRRWDPKKRIVPIFQRQPGRSHRRQVLGETGGTTITNAWSGGSLKGQWASCLGFWQVPNVSQPTQPPGQDGGWISSSWIGIDGAYGPKADNDVLQAGIDQAVDAAGKPSFVAWFEWFAPGTRVVNNETSGFGPSMASCRGNLYLAWKGDDDLLNIITSTDDGNDFRGKVTLSEASSDGPALASDGQDLFLAWKGDGNDDLNVAMVAFDANNFPTGIDPTTKRTLTEQSPNRPALAMLRGRIFIAWKGGDDHLNIKVSSDHGNSFTNKLVTSEKSAAAPALGNAGDNLFIAWKGDGNDNLNVAEVGIDASGFPIGLTKKPPLPGKSPLRPALAGLVESFPPFGDVLFIAWRGDGNDQLNLAHSQNDGLSFTGTFLSPEQSSDAPALAAHKMADGSVVIFIAWKGDGDDFLYVQPGTVFGDPEPNYLTQFNIPNFPVKPGDTIFCSVQYINSNTQGQITLANDTTGHIFSIALTPPPGASFKGDSVEWIMEAPNGGLPNTSLPSFTPVTFTSALALGADGTTIGDPKNADISDIQNIWLPPPLVPPPNMLTQTTVGTGTLTVTFVG